VRRKRLPLPDFKNQMRCRCCMFGISPFVQQLKKEQKR
jgi:hypothetical protein